MAGVTLLKHMQNKQTVGRNVYTLSRRRFHPDMFYNIIVTFSFVVRFLYIATLFWTV
ncbi:hypothetical protein SAMN05216331_11310 [Porphyromonadaceae bacterium KH3R12]|nr:hypothetical protein SAMN05216331_11310 [Porphyromonadaceae bacterium KH3R12]